MSAPTPTIRYEWYQSNSTVTISVFIKHADASALSINVTPTSLSLSLPTSSNSDLGLDLDPLSGPVVPETMKETRKSLGTNNTKVELVLEKKAPGLMWAKLEAEQGGETLTTQAEPIPQHPYPSSLPASKPRKNWDALVSDFTKTEEEQDKAAGKDPNASGDKQLNELFQKLYADATDEQRKAMIKSYQESNGTALSTNWDEVSKAPVETKPPDSMIAKKWGK